MASIAAVLVLLAILVLGIAAGLFVRWTATESSTERPVLPAQYYSLFHTDPSKRPGYCPECGTENDPEFTICRNCSSRLPTQDRDRSSRDIKRIFE